MTGRSAFRPVIRSKLVPARLPDGLIQRSRVLARLSIECRFTLVSAMPGYGKTAAVRQWIDTVDLPVAWVSLDMLDQEPESFWSNVLLALDAAVPGIADEPTLLLRERGARDHLFLGALVAALVELERPVLLVLDGLDGNLDRLAIDGLTLLVERAGEWLRLVATTRSDPPLPLARWRALGWLNDLREDSLRLTDEEATAIAAAADTAIRDEAELIALNRRVDGWPIGLHMALLARPAGVEQAAIDLSIGSDRLMANYLLVEVLEAMSEEERDVALALSVLEWFDPDLCAELIGEHAVPVIRQLLGRGMFLSVVDPRVAAMRFHDLFRELMEMELAWRDPARRLDLHRQAAILWRSRGDLMSAYHHLSVIGEASTAKDLLIGPALALVDAGDLGALQQFARQLPAPQVVANVNLALDLAVVALYASGTLAARRWRDRAAVLIGNGAEPGDGGADEERLRVLGLGCTIALLEGDLDGALSGIELHRRLETGAPSVFERRFPIIAARAMLAARRQHEADEWISSAEKLIGPEIVTEVVVPTLRAWYEWIFGSLHESEALIDGALGWMSEHGTGAHHLAFDTLITAGWCRLSAGDVPDAARLSGRATQDAEVIGCAWNHLQAGFLAARLALITGEPTRALKIVDDLREVAPFETCRSYSDRLLGLEVEALAAVGRQLDAVRALGSLEPGPRASLLRARYAVAADREVEALLAERASWPVVERLQAELVLTARTNVSTPRPELVELIAECGTSGWVLPFLGFGPRVERQLRAAPLERLHPRLARTLDYLAPLAHAETSPAPGIRLTSREVTLIELLPTHLSYAEMGERLYLSVNTVKSNLKSLYRKLGATTRTEAVEIGRRAGLL